MGNYDYTARVFFQGPSNTIRSVTQNPRIVNFHGMDILRPFHEQGKRLKAARKAKGLTLQALSDLLNGLYSVSRLSNYEQGTRAMSPNVARTLADVLENVTAATLVGLDDEEITPDEYEVLRDYRAADERGKSTIRAVIKAQIS